LAAGLRDIGFDVHHSGDTYFERRPASCRLLRQHRAGVAAIPLSAFCDPDGEHAETWNHLERFTLCKRDDTLDEALHRLTMLSIGALCSRAVTLRSHRFE
jgi:N-succinyldiaminopimelate aminotransferase